MSAAYIMARAEMRTGLSDWGDSEFLPRLHLFMACIRADAGLTEAGRENLEATALRFAEGRLRLERLVADHPEILDITLTRPIIVTGLPRSGTTALVTALAAHPDLQFLRYRDVAEPFGDPKPSHVASQADELEQVVPGIHKLHDMTPSAHADDTELQGLAFAGYGLEWLCRAPKWNDQYLAADQLAAYRYMKLAMQALAFRRGSECRWIIKNPQHMEQLHAVKAVFPDALLVVAARDADARLRSMGKVMDALVPNLRLNTIPAHYWKARFAAMQARYDDSCSLFPDRIELSRGAPGDIRQTVWRAANLQPAPVAA